MYKGAKMAVEDINAAGGIKALGGAKMKLVVVDAGDKVETGAKCCRAHAFAESKPHGCNGFLAFVLHVGHHRGH